MEKSQAAIKVIKKIPWFVKKSWSYIVVINKPLSYVKFFLGVTPALVMFVIATYKDIIKVDK